jgi:hypothetical protein
MPFHFLQLDLADNSQRPAEEYKARIAGEMTGCSHAGKKAAVAMMSRL